LQDSFRASRHLGRRGCIIERLIGVACHAYMVPMWQQWSRHPGVTEADLEAALARLRDDWKMTPPISDQMKIEYLMVMNEGKMPMTMLRSEFGDAIDEAAIQRLGLSAKGVLSKLDTFVPYWQIPVLWTCGEPELSARAVRLYMAHELKTCDLPYAQQPERISGAFPLCRIPEGTSGLSAEAIRDRIQMTFASYLLGALGSVQQSVRNEAGREALLETELELQMRYRHGGGTSRADAEQLLSDFPWPVDPCSAEGKPILFRFADEGLVLWSVSWDGIDQGGELEPPQANRGQDTVVVIPWPGEGSARAETE
jgi:hypothetical protein